MSLVLSSPPPTSIEPVTDVLHGVPITDPYRWLEDQTSPRTRKWLEEQTGYTRGYLDAIPGRQRIRRRVEELLDTEVVSQPIKLGERYFFLKRTSRQQQPVIMMREGPSGGDIPLVDPATRFEDTSASVGIMRVSNDGKLLAYSVRVGGEDPFSIEFFDVDRRETLQDRLPRGSCAALAISSDARGFYYVHRAADATRPHYRAVYWHEFGTGHAEDAEIFFAGEDPRLLLGLRTSSNGNFLLYHIVRLSEPRTTDIYFQDKGLGIPPRRIVHGAEGLLLPFFVGDSLIAVTDWKSPNRRIVEIDPRYPGSENWREIVPEVSCRIHNLSVVDRLLFVDYVENLTSRVDVFDFWGRRRETIPLPCKGTARLVHPHPESDALFYEFSSFAYPPTMFCYQPRSDDHLVWAQNQVPFDPSLIKVEEVNYVSKDGSDIPMFLVAKKGRRERSLSTFLTAYGGFGVSMTPQFSALSTFLVEKGFLVAIANIRGGAEFGEQWHLNGKRHNRQTAIDDFIAAADWLVSKGHTNAMSLAIGGGSNAGLLVAAALTQRPDLFRAAICLGPILDMVRYHLFDEAARWIDEYGSSENADDFRFLMGYSPYHRVEGGVRYPAVLLISGDADTRCNPMHARKMTARLQAASRSGRPILLDYRTKWGHVPAQPLMSRIEAVTDRLAFICQELGVSV